MLITFMIEFVSYITCRKLVDGFLLPVLDFKYVKKVREEATTSQPPRFHIPENQNPVTTLTFNNPRLHINNVERT